jgi:hypothetical protein
LHRGVIAYVVILVLLIVGALIYTGTRFLSPVLHTTTSTIATTSTVSTSNTPNATSTTPTTINYSNSVSPCSNFQLIGQQLNSQYIAKCITNGSTLGLWVAAGNAGTEQVRIVGADGRTYINQSSNYNCTTFFKNFSAPAQIYTITLTTGLGGGTCGNPHIIINTTTTLPAVVYTKIYNGNFGNGQYTGWQVQGKGFGAAPTNITGANKEMCYQGQPWSNYNGTYFATTYVCGTSVAPGNLTSSTFIVEPSTPFLNFRIVSPQDNNIYFELLRNNTAVVIAHFNTYNLSITYNSSSTFQNVTIPLTAYIGQQLKLKVVSTTLQNYAAMGDFALAKRPDQQHGVAVNITVLSN